jgi:lipopolysaccharide transport system permease protein
MARVALPTEWLGALAQRRGPLRTYQWIWLVLCVVGALALAAPRILSRPIIYTSSATTQLDRQRYAPLFDQGLADPDYLAVETITFELLRARYPELGSPTFGVRYEPQLDGQIRVLAVASSAGAAQALADDAAEQLARNLRAAGGREIMRNLLGWEFVVSLNAQPPASEFQRRLREVLRWSAFPLNRPVEPVSEQITVAQLPREELSDLTRALEVRYDQIELIDSARLRLERENLPANEAQRLGQIDSDLQRLADGRVALGGALAYLYQQHAATFVPDAPSAVYRSTRAALPPAPEDRQIALWLVVVTLAGIGFGGLSVAADQNGQALRKFQEIWAYRELIRNLVLRDLRTRYKGSALGYLWTQLAPLLLMLVFWFVFSSIFPSGIAMFPVFLIVALLPWNYCAEAVTSGARSVIDNAALIKKVFFPREVLPLVSVFSALLNYVLSLPTLLALMAAVQFFYAPLREQGQWFNFSWTLVYLPVILMIQTIFLAGVALFLGAFSVFFRDAVHLLGIVVQFWFFLTPVVYAVDLLNLSPLQAQLLRWLNPMASLIEFYREVLYGSAVGIGQVPTPAVPALDSVVRVLITALAMLAFGYWFFQRQSGKFGEEI